MTGSSTRGNGSLSSDSHPNRWLLPKLDRFCLVPYGTRPGWPTQTHWRRQLAAGTTTVGGHMRGERYGYAVSNGSLTNLRIGVIGYGYWGPKHVRVLRSLAYVDVYVAEPDPARADAVVRAAPGIRVAANMN